MGRSAANNITQSGSTEWSKRDKSTYDPTDDIEAYALNASGVVNIIVFDPKGWALFRSFKAVREKLDTRRGSHSELETAVKDLGNPVYPEVFLTDGQRVAAPQLPHLISPDKQGRAGAFNAYALSGIADIFRVIKNTTYYCAGLLTGCHGG